MYANLLAYSLCYNFLDITLSSHIQKLLHTNLLSRNCFVEVYDLLPSCLLIESVGSIFSFNCVSLVTHCTILNKSVMWPSLILTITQLFLDLPAVRLPSYNVQLSQWFLTLIDLIVILFSFISSHGFTI